MKAIILAAGVGSRLKKYTKDLPKCMLSFAGKPLIKHQIDLLRKVGIKSIIVVKGYLPDKINYPNIKYYINREYPITNMVESLFKAEAGMDDDIIICYGDILYEERVIKAVIESKAEIAVAVDKDYKEYWKLRLDSYEKDIESLVVKNGKIVELGEANCTIDKAQYRYIGLIKFSKTGVEKFKQAYIENKEKYYNSDKPWKRSKNFKNAYMTCMLQELIDRGYNIDPIVVSHGWLEFDNTEDYEKAQQWLKNGTIKKFIKLR